MVKKFFREQRKLNNLNIELIWQKKKSEPEVTIKIEPHPEMLHKAWWYGRGILNPPIFIERGSNYLYLGLNGYRILRFILEIHKHRHVHIHVK